jgi:hypothetical protein
MTFTVRYKVFGRNDAILQGEAKLEETTHNNFLQHEISAPNPDHANPKDPLYRNQKWRLLFFEYRGIFKNPEANQSSTLINVPNGTVVTAWYAEEGGSGDHTFSLTPFIVSRGFVKTTNPFVEFSKVSPPNAKISDNSVDTDLMNEQKVTGTVHPELAEFAAVFDHLFEYGIDGQGDLTTGNEATAKRGRNLWVLAIFKVPVSIGSNFVLTTDDSYTIMTEGAAIVVDRKTGEVKGVFPEHPVLDPAHAKLRTTFAAITTPFTKDAKGVVGLHTKTARADFLSRMKSLEASVNKITKGPS